MSADGFGDGMGQGTQHTWLTDSLTEFSSQLEEMVGGHPEALADRIERGLSAVLAVAMVFLRVLEPTCPLLGLSGHRSSKLEACGGPEECCPEAASPAVEMEASHGQGSEGAKPLEKVK